MSVAAQFEAHASEDLSSPFYFNASHWRAMDGIVDGVKAREGIMVMTGPTGSGKTMLMRAISENVGEGVTPLFLQYASLNFREFVNFLHNSLNVGDIIHDASNKAVALKKFLYAQAESKETAVVFVDEAQNLEPDVLRMLPKLACFDQLEDGTNVGLQFMLTGGSELREVLEDSDFADVRDSIARTYDLRFFTREELKYFLEKRLAPLERMTPQPITESAIEAVGKYTGGSPRLIGMICSHAMLFAAENPGRSIDEAMIEEAAEALMIEPVENPFAHEDDDLAELSGPFSSADLRGEETAESADSAAEPEMDTDMPIADAASTEYDEKAMMESDGFDFAAESTDDSGADAVMGEMGMGLDIETIDDDDFDDDDLDDEFEAAAMAGGAVGAGSLMSKLGGKFTLPGRKSDSLKVLGAGRKGGSDGRAAAPNEKRKMKTRVAGERQKQAKFAVAAAIAAVIGAGVYVKRTDIAQVFASAKETVASTASSAVDSVKTVASSSADAVGDSVRQTTAALTQTSAPTPFPAEEPAEPVAATRVVGSGWDAKVEVLQPIRKPEKTADTRIAMPEAGVSLARGALDLVGSALEAGAEAAPTELGNALKVASADVKDLRKAATLNGATDAEREARVAKLVAEGDAYYKNQLYIAPRGGNAYDAYREALDLDETNEDALEGVEALRAFYSKKADAARAAKQWDRANRHFETALAISKRRAVR